MTNVKSVYEGLSSSLFSRRLVKLGALLNDLATFAWPCGRELWRTVKRLRTTMTSLAIDRRRRRCGKTRSTMSPRSNTSSFRRPRRPMRRLPPFVAADAGTRRRRIVSSGVATTSSSRQVRRLTPIRLARSFRRASCCCFFLLRIGPYFRSKVSKGKYENYDVSQVRRAESVARAIPSVSRSS